MQDLRVLQWCCWRC